MDIPDRFLDEVPNLYHCSVSLWLCVYRGGKRRVNPAGEAMRVLTFSQRHNPAGLPRMSVNRAVDQLVGLRFLAVYPSRVLTRPDLYGVPEFPPFAIGAGTKVSPPSGRWSKSGTTDLSRGGTIIRPPLRADQIGGGTIIRPHNVVVVVDTDPLTGMDIIQQQLPGLLGGAELDQDDRKTLSEWLDWLELANADQLLADYGESRVYEVCNYVFRQRQLKRDIRNPAGMVLYLLQSHSKVSEVVY